MRQHVDESDESSARNSHQMKFFQPQQVRQRVKVFGNCSGLRTGSRIGHAAAPSAAVERDDAISRFLKCRNVVLPAFAVTGIRVQQNKWDSAATCIGKPEANAGQVRISSLLRLRSANDDRCNRDNER